MSPNTKYVIIVERKTKVLFMSVEVEFGKLSYQLKIMKIDS